MCCRNIRIRRIRPQYQKAVEDFINDLQPLIILPATARSGIDPDGAAVCACADPGAGIYAGGRDAARWGEQRASGKDERGGGGIFLFRTVTGGEAGGFFVADDQADA